MSAKTKKLVLLWLPVALLPLSNVIAFICCKTVYSFKETLPWAIGAVAEELFFRCFLLELLFLPRRRPVPSVIAVSLLFAALHFLNLLAGQTVSEVLVICYCAFAFSVWAGAATAKATFLIPLLAHLLLNLTAVTDLPWLSAAVSTAVMIDGALLLRGTEREAR